MTATNDSTRAAGASTISISLKKIGDRRSLAPRRDPFFEPIGGFTHASLGFRKIGAVGSDEGTWVVRQRIEQGGKTRYAFRSLGSKASYDAAVTAAREHLTLKDQG